MSIQNNSKLFEILISDQKNQNKIYLHGPFWEKYHLRIVKSIRADGIKSFRSNASIGKGFADTLVSDPFELLTDVSFKSKFLKKIIKNSFLSKYVFSFYIRKIKSLSNEKIFFRNQFFNLKHGEWFKNLKKTYNLPNACLENPSDVINLCGETIGKSYFDSYVRIYNFSQVVDFNNKKSLFEIGGGFGANIHVLISMYPNIKKIVYLDIPPLLYIATEYLKSIYNNSVIDYLVTKNNESINFKDDDSLEIICIAPWQIEKLDSDIDLFWNSSSFQEMSLNMVSNYLDYLKLVTNDNTSFCTYFYDSKYFTESKDLLKIQDLISKTFSKDFYEVEQRVRVDESKYFVW